MTTSNGSTSSVSFVCCVESGWLEAQTVRLVESLRRHAGALAGAPIFAVQPRFGPPVTRVTREYFARRNVEYLRRSSVGPYDWLKFFNKPVALAMAEERATTDVISWVDGDLLALQEPADLALSGVDFVACASDKEQGTIGPSDPFEPLWAELTRAAGLSLEALPWIHTELDGKRIRLYWNSGLFSYRRSARLGLEYERVCRQLVDASVVSSHPRYSTGINEMAALGFAMLRLGLTYRALPAEYNYPLSPHTPPEWYSDEAFARTKIVHYHDAMVPEFWPTFMERLGRCHPHVAEWLGPLGPMRNEAPLTYRLFNKALGGLRSRRERGYRQACRVAALP